MNDNNVNANSRSAKEKPYVSELISEAVRQKPDEDKDVVREIKRPSTADVIAHQLAHPVKEIGKAQIIVGIVAIISAIMAIAGLIAEW